MTFFFLTGTVTSLNPMNYGRRSNLSLMPLHYHWQIFLRYNIMKARISLKESWILNTCHLWKGLFSIIASLSHVAEAVRSLIVFYWQRLTLVCISKIKWEFSGTLVTNRINSASYFISHHILLVIWCMKYMFRRLMHLDKAGQFCCWDEICIRIFHSLDGTFSPWDSFILQMLLVS